MARLDRVKNLTGLVKWFGENEELRQMVNLVVVGGDINPTKSRDREEVNEIEIMHSLMAEYNLPGYVHKRIVSGMGNCTDILLIQEELLCRYIHTHTSKLRWYPMTYL